MAWWCYGAVTANMWLLGVHRWQQRGQRRSFTGKAGWSIEWWLGIVWVAGDHIMLELYGVRVDRPGLGCADRGLRWTLKSLCSVRAAIRRSLEGVFWPTVG